MGCSWAALGRSWAALGGSRAALGRSWPILGRSWAAVGRSWAALGPLLGRSWALLAALGPLWGRSWPLFGQSWPLLGRSWAALGRSWGPSWHPCGPSWAPRANSQPFFTLLGCLRIRFHPFFVRFSYDFLHETAFFQPCSGDPPLLRGGLCAAPGIRPRAPPRSGVFEPVKTSAVYPLRDPFGRDRKVSAAIASPPEATRFRSFFSLFLLSFCFLYFWSFFL